MPYELVAEGFHIEKPCSRISSRNVNFLWKTSILLFQSPFKGLGAMHTVHIRLMGKPIEDFLLVVIELFLSGCFG